MLRETIQRFLYNSSLLDFVFEQKKIQIQCFLTHESAE